MTWFAWWSSLGGLPGIIELNNHYNRAWTSAPKSKWIRSWHTSLKLCHSYSRPYFRICPSITMPSWRTWWWRIHKGLWTSKPSCNYRWVWISGRITPKFMLALRRWRGNASSLRNFCVWISGFADSALSRTASPLESISLSMWRDCLRGSQLKKSFSSLATLSRSFGSTTRSRKDGPSLLWTIGRLLKRWRRSNLRTKM